MSGIYLSLRGVYIANNSYVDVDDIGEADAALLCHTNKIDCCRFFREGEWYFPNSSQVQTEAWHYSSGFSEFFYRNRQEQAVRLNRRGNPLERGHFHCVIPDANYVNQILNVNICELLSRFSLCPPLSLSPPPPLFLTHTHTLR